MIRGDGAWTGRARPAGPRRPPAAARDFDLGAWGGFFIFQGLRLQVVSSYPTVWCFNIVPPAIPDRADGDGQRPRGRRHRHPGSARRCAGRMEKFQSFVGPAVPSCRGRGGSRRPIRVKRKLNPDVLVRPHPARLTRLTSAVSHSRSAPAVSSARLEGCGWCACGRAL